MNIVEVCCGSYYDAKEAMLGGADRIELNSALYLGGLTPSFATFSMVKSELNIKTICMVRPRGAGFLYNDEDTEVMYKDCEIFLKNGADGIAFGFLTKHNEIDEKKTEKMVKLIKKYGGEAVFHRAFDCVKDPYKSIEKLINLGIDRILTSGLEDKAIKGVSLICELQNKYGKNIDIVAGSGINDKNAKNIIKDTGIYQIHSSCKTYVKDETTSKDNVTYAYLSDENQNCYDCVCKEIVKKLKGSVK